MTSKHLKIISFSSLIIAGIILTLEIWELINWENKIYVKLITTLLIIFFISTMILGIIQRDSKK